MISKLKFQIVLLLAAGCQPAVMPVKPVVTAPVQVGGVQTLDAADQGVRFQYPAGWTVDKNDTATFKAVAPAGSVALFYDYRKLNGLEAAFATAKLIDSHYVDDRKSNWAPDAAVTDDRAITVPDADARRVALVGHKGGKTLSSIAAMILHRGQVYVFTVESDAAEADAAGRVLDQTVGSIRWTK